MDPGSARFARKPRGPAPRAPRVLPGREEGSESGARAQGPCGSSPGVASLSGRWRGIVRGTGADPGSVTPPGAPKVAARGLWGLALLFPRPSCPPGPGDPEAESGHRPLAGQRGACSPFPPGTGVLRSLLCPLHSQQELPSPPLPSNQPEPGPPWSPHSPGSGLLQRCPRLSVDTMVLGPGGEPQPPWPPGCPPLALLPPTRQPTPGPPPVICLHPTYKSWLSCHKPSTATAAPSLPSQSLYFFLQDCRLGGSGLGPQGGICPCLGPQECESWCRGLWPPVGGGEEHRANQLLWVRS